MKGAPALVRWLIAESGYDLPCSPALPPMDAAGQIAAAVALALSEFAGTLGVVTDPSVTRSLFPPARSLTEIRLALATLHLALAFAEAELGLPDLSTAAVPDGIEDGFRELIRRVRQPGTTQAT